MISRELVPFGFELLSQCRMIVNFAVEDDPNSAVLIRHWLIASFQIDDGKAAETQCDVSSQVEPVPVRASVHDAGGHAPNSIDRVSAFAKMQDTGNPTHLS
jgi:hypothetical protein